MTMDINAIMAETLWHIDAEVEKGGWDQNALLFAVIVGELGEGVGVIELAPAPGWNVVLDITEDPKDALRALSLMTQVAPRALIEQAYPPDQFYGLAFVTEAWMLRPALGESLPPTVSFAGKVKDHPDRIETRIIFCVSVDGKVAALSHERDGIPEAYTEESGESLSGAIPDLLNEIIEGVRK